MTEKLYKSLENELGKLLGYFFDSDAINPCDFLTDMPKHEQPKHEQYEWKEIRDKFEETAVKQISPGLYQIGKDGPIMGEDGLKMLDEAMKEEIKKRYGKTNK